METLKNTTQAGSPVQANKTDVLSVESMTQAGLGIQSYISAITCPSSRLPPHPSPSPTPKVTLPLICPHTIPVIQLPSRIKFQ